MLNGPRSRKTEPSAEAQITSLAPGSSRKLTAWPPNNALTRYLRPPGTSSTVVVDGQELPELSELLGSKRSSAWASI